MVYTRITANSSANILQVLSDYNLDTKKCVIRQNILANVNKVFLIKIRSLKYILRESSPSTTLAHLQLETDILTYLAQKNFQLTPHLFPNIKSHLITEHDGKYYTLQTCLPGEAKESVSNLVRFNDRKLVNLFKTAARFTRKIQGFKSQKLHNNKSLYFYSKNGKSILKELVKKHLSAQVKKLLNENAEFLNSFIDDTFREMQVYKYDEQPKQIVHFDIHPGNVNYIGDKVVGLFDFDWARLDCRITDLACTIGQACYKYRGKSRAIYNRKKVKLGLKAYREVYGKSEYDLTVENQLLRAAFKTYMLYQLFWTIEWANNNPNKQADGLKYIAFAIDVLKLNNFNELIE